jgi:hypothetical protein
VPHLDPPPSPSQPPGRAPRPRLEAGPIGGPRSG